MTSLVCGLIALGISFFLPKWYRGEAEIMPLYRSSTELGAVANLASGLLSIGGGGGDYVLPMMITPSDLWGALAKSNAVVDSLIAQFDLAKRYKQPIREKLREMVRDHMDIEVTGEGLLLVRYEDKVPAVSAEITNALVDELEKINVNLRMSSASASREFIENRLKETELALAMAESTFAKFQKEHGAISIEDQTRVAIENVSQLKAELAIAQVELGILRTSKKSEHGEVGEIQKRVELIRKKLKDLETGEDKDERFGLRDIPDLAIQYARLLRELTVQQLLYEYLIQQFEQARIEEKKDTPILQVLSRSAIPEKKARPKRLLISVLSFAGAFILCSLWVLGSGSLREMREKKPEDYARLVSYIKGKRKE